MSGSALPDAFYYLRNFEQAIHWVVERNGELLSEAEREFTTQLSGLSVPARALLARLSMRRGTLFRRSKIRYTEIESLPDALNDLIAMGWLDPRPALTLQEIFRLSTRKELAQRFRELGPRVTKEEAYHRLAEEHVGVRAFEDWLNTDEAVYRVSVAPLVLNFRLLHFGNFWQGWEEYTLAHLQIFRYEPVPIDRVSRPFETREDIDFFYALYRCHEALSDGAELSELLALLPVGHSVQGWLRRRWEQLRFQLGREAERCDDVEAALQLYRGNSQPEARVRHVRLLERLERDEEALAVAQALLEEDASDFIQQRMLRIMMRLARRGGAKQVRRVERVERVAWPVVELQLSRDPDFPVEVLVQTHLSNADAPVYYVENGLLGSLFGLLCWEAIFQPVPGAFFHPFQSGPADLGCSDFVGRRRAAFDCCLRRLDTDEYRSTILTTFAQKNGTSAPFVHWHAVDEQTLQLALECIPASDLRLYSLACSRT